MMLRLLVDVAFLAYGSLMGGAVAHIVAWWVSGDALVSALIGLLIGVVLALYLGFEMWIRSG